MVKRALFLVILKLWPQCLILHCESIISGLSIIMPSIRVEGSFWHFLRTNADLIYANLLIFLIAGRLFKKIELNESIRYASDDPIESWLNNLLCLDVANCIPNINR